MIACQMLDLSFLEEAPNTVRTNQFSRHGHGFTETLAVKPVLYLTLKLLSDLLLESVAELDGIGSVLVASRFEG